MRILRSQKNQLFDAIEREGFSPTMFNYNEGRTNASDTMLFLKNSDYFFRFNINPDDSFSMRFSPGKELIAEVAHVSNWFNLVLVFIEWLQSSAREMEEPDKWTTLEEEIKSANFEDIKYENTQFTAQEYKLLEKSIEELKEKISKLDLLEKQITQINKKLDHLLKLAESMNKSDWKDLFVGALISLTLQLTIDKETGQSLFTYARELFTKFLPQLTS